MLSRPVAESSSLQGNRQARRLACGPGGDHGGDGYGVAWGIVTICGSVFGRWPAVAGGMMAPGTKGVGLGGNRPGPSMIVWEFSRGPPGQAPVAQPGAGEAAISSQSVQVRPNQLPGCSMSQFIEQPDRKSKLPASASE